MPEILYLALGDSYTIGTGAQDPSRSFPALLAGRLREATGEAVRLVNPAVDGYTAGDVLERELSWLHSEPPQRVSVLAGANDVARGRSLDHYGRDLTAILDAVAQIGAPPRHTVVVSVPDWSVTPAAADYGRPAELRRRIEAANGLAASEAAARGFPFADVTEVSRRPARGEGWLSPDGLHPGDAQYAAWAEAIWAVVGDSWAG
ncbi:MAG: SGNH/GDSL hydrolase family protein [Candidatus Dormibacterales bacterium]